MQFYHGTSSKSMSNIIEHGLQSPYLTNNYDIAEYYAECAAEADDSDLVVLLVEVHDPSLLRYDGSAMDEPVIVSESVRDEHWEKISMQHPEWIKNSSLIVPADQWQYSLAAVNSVWHDGTLTSFSVDD